MFLLQPLFWIIIGLGLALPSTFTIVINLAIKIKAGDEYEFHIASLFKVYLIALVGWSIFFTEVIR